MNKYQKAKETLEKYDYSTKLELSEGIRNDITSDITVDQFFAMKETCIELLDKATPVKRTITNGRPYCPKCSYSLLIQDVWEMSYCCACGQKIDWRQSSGK